jgi:hypothetical protein
MNFNKDILKQIEQMGATGKTADMIALEFNMTQTDMDDERAKDKNLDEAMNRAQLNAERYALQKLFNESISGKNSLLAREMFIKLNEKLNKNSDNKIEIEYV